MSRVSHAFFTSILLPISPAIYLRGMQFADVILITDNGYVVQLMIVNWCVNNWRMDIKMNKQVGLLNLKADSSKANS